MRAVLYTRVSTLDKRQQTANQLEQLRTACRARFWETGGDLSLSSGLSLLGTHVAVACPTATVPPALRGSVGTVCRVLM
jgi:hypothetical protein